jgi:hypothetical protein
MTARIYSLKKMMKTLAIAELMPGGDAAWLGPRAQGSGYAHTPARCTHVLSIQLGSAGEPSGMPGKTE